jgi:hypothetical protein
MNDLPCPSCRAPYPRWRIVFTPGVFRCPSCHARLTFSLDSMRRAGWISALALFSSAALADLVLGFDQLTTWRFLAWLLVFALVLGQVIRAIVGVLVLRDDLHPLDRQPK